MVRVSLLLREENPSLHLIPDSRHPGGLWSARTAVCRTCHHTSVHGGNGQLAFTTHRQFEFENVK